MTDWMQLASERAAEKHALYCPCGGYMPEDFAAAERTDVAS